MLTLPEITLVMHSSHIKRIDRANRRKIRKMASSAIYKSVKKVRAKNFRAISAVDDLTCYSLGPWIDEFSIGLANAARRCGISVVGGEMAQMPDSYALGYVGVIVTVIGVKL